MPYGSAPPCGISVLLRSAMRCRRFTRSPSWLRSSTGSCGLRRIDNRSTRRIFAATHRLADLEAFKLRMVEVERLVLAGVPMGKTKCFRLGPGFERLLVLPYRV